MPIGEYLCMRCRQMHPLDSSCPQAAAAQAIGGLLDRSYTAEEIGDLGRVGSTAMAQGGVPAIVVLTAHVAAAATLLEDALACGPVLAEFGKSLRALNAIAELFLLVCETGPVSGGKRPQ